MEERITDEEHNAEIDRMDAIRFRRLIKAGLNNEVWFMRACEKQGSEPKTLAEVRGILDYVLVMERTRKGDLRDVASAQPGLDSGASNASETTTG